MVVQKWRPLSQDSAMTSQAFFRVCCCGCAPAIVNQDDLHKIHSIYTNKSNTYIIDLGFYIHIYICTYFIMCIHAYWRTHLLLFTWYGSLSLIVQFLALALIFTFHDCIYRRGYTQRDYKGTTVDGWNPAPPRMMVIPYPIIYRILTIPGGAGFCPSTVFQIFSPKKPDLHPRIKWHIPCLGSFCVLFTGTTPLMLMEFLCLFFLGRLVCWVCLKASPTVFADVVFSYLVEWFFSDSQPQKSTKHKWQGSLEWLGFLLKVICYFSVTIE